MKVIKNILIAFSPIILCLSYACGMAFPLKKESNNPTRLLLIDLNRGGDLKYLESLIVAGADVNAVNKNGQTPLHIIINKAIRPKMIYLLLEAGARLDIKNNLGYTACDIFSKRKDLNLGFSDLSTLDDVSRDRVNRYATIDELLVFALFVHRLALDHILEKYPQILTETEVLNDPRVKEKTRVLEVSSALRSCILRDYIFNKCPKIAQDYRDYYSRRFSEFTVHIKREIFKNGSKE